MAAVIKPFGTHSNGTPVQAITLHGGALTATVLTHGAVLQSLYLDGVAHSLTLGFPDLGPYENEGAYFGPIVAPVINRIGGARAVIDGQEHRFAANENSITLHSGPTGSHTAQWTIADHSAAHVTLTLRQAAGTGGFPGTRDLTVTYRLENSSLHLLISAKTDAPTLMNAGHHGYWNLDGAPTWDGHRLWIEADHILPTTAQNLPTGEEQSLDGHPHDFRASRTLTIGGQPHLDHNFCLARARREIRPVLRLTGAAGVSLEVATTEPGVQIFDAAPIGTGRAPTLHGHDYGAHCGLAIEPQSWPDAPHHGAFPDITLHPDAEYCQTTIYRLSRPGG